jgi:glutamate synthase (NADPH/NADH) large chain
MLENLTHRGAVGADPLMGDGAGMLVQIPDALFPRRNGRPKGVDAAAGRLCRRLPVSCRRTRSCARISKDIIAESVVAEEGQTLLGFRDVPVDNSSLSKAPEIVASEPVHRQVFIGQGETTPGGDDFERRLFILRKVISNRIYGEHRRPRQRLLHRLAVDSRTIVYKGMFLAYQVGAYYKDLTDERFTSALALVHQRFSTNTFPSWKLPTLPDGRAQWRDQHAARQRQLDGGAPGVGGLRAVWRRHLQALADLL